MQDLVDISLSVASSPYLTQGGGGNTSVKSEDVMYIKPSGFFLKDIEKGHVELNYKNISDKLKNELYLQPDSEFKLDVEKEIINPNGLLPSMETGFHAVLDSYVIHTHPLAVNLILCSDECETKLKELFFDVPYLLLPYLNPGYPLSKSIANCINKLPSTPKIIFLKNHGLIVHSNDKNEAIELHQMVVKRIEDCYDLKSELNFEWIKIQENMFELQSEEIQLLVLNPDLLNMYLFPDQAVVIGENWGLNNNNKKINIISQENKIQIFANEKNSIAIAENLIAVSYIQFYSQKLNFKLNELSKNDVDFILNLDTEKYRQNILNKHG